MSASGRTKQPTRNVGDSLRRRGRRRRMFVVNKNSKEEASQPPEQLHSAANLLLCPQCRRWRFASSSSSLCLRCGREDDAGRESSISCSLSLKTIFKFHLSSKVACRGQGTEELMPDEIAAATVVKYLALLPEWRSDDEADDVRKE